MKQDMVKSYSKMVENQHWRNRRNLRTNREDWTICEHSPTGDSDANGVVERAIHTFQGKFRTWNGALEYSIEDRVDKYENIMT